jgi:hypothetical protein
MKLSRRSLLASLSGSLLALAFGSRSAKARTKEIVGQTFSREDVDLTGKTFVDCTFHRVRTSGKDFTLRNCRLLQCSTLRDEGNTIIYGCWFVGPFMSGGS